MRRLASAGAALAGLVVALLACADEDGVNPGEIRIEAIAEDTGSAASELPSDACMLTPVLLGGRRTQSFTVTSTMSLELDATREEVRIRLPGAASSDAPRALTRDEWTEGRAFTATTRSGDRYLITLSSPCPTPVDAGADGED